MHLEELVLPAARVIDVGVTDEVAARHLSGLGRDRYLGLVPPAELAGARARADHLAGRLHPLTSADQVTQNNADVIVLRAPFGRFLWNAINAQRAHYVLVESQSRTEALEAALARFTGRSSRRVTAVGSVVLGGTTFTVVELVRRPSHRARRYLSEVLGVPGLIDELERAQVDYASLRWFEKLPQIDPGEDLDVLVADDDLEKVQTLLDAEPGTIPVDLYSVSGLPGSDFRNAAYYQPNLAQKILANAVQHDNSGCHVPSPEDHLHSLAYHALYHKGYRSGLPSTTTTNRVTDPEHDYGQVLAELAERLGRTLPTTLEGIDDYLESVGWRPSRDALRRLSSDNAWVEQRFFADEPAQELPEPTMFLLRERTLDSITTDEAVAVIERLGFEILARRELDGAAKERCASHARGGNWGRGPFPVSGGVPAVAIFAVHYGPRPPAAPLRARYPHLTNEDALTAKLQIRDLVNARQEKGRYFNPLHSSDNASEAWEYVDLALPEDAERLREAVAERREQYRSDPSVVRTLSVGRRAKVEVLDHGAGPVVRKTYAPPFRHYLEREVSAMREVGAQVAAVPPILAEGLGWFELPFYTDRLPAVTSGRQAELLPLGVVREMVDVLRELNALGVDLVDAKPGNFLLDENGLRVIDFEFAHRYDGDPPPLAKSLSFAGIPDDFDGDLPVSELSYDYRWRYATGLGVDELLAGSPTTQHLQRLLHRVRMTTNGSHGVVRRVGRLPKRAVRRSRRILEEWGVKRAVATFERVG